MVNSIKYKKTSIILVLTLFTSSLFCQTNFKLKGEGHDDKVSVWVRLDKWDQNLDGYYIKRRSVNENGDAGKWKKLHKNMLVPGNESNKNLSNVTNNKKLVAELDELRTVYLNNAAEGETKISSITEDELKTQLSDPEVAQMIELLFAYDYKIALMFGFGYVDFNKPKSYAVEYGVFPVINSNESSNPSATYKWVVGTKTDLTINIEKQNIKKRRNKVKLEWVFDKDSFDANDNLAGFNIMRKPVGGSYEKINKNTIWVNKGATRRLVIYYDTIPSTDISYSYALVPLSFFNTEGDYYEIKLNTNIPDEVPPPVIKSDMPYGYDFVNNGAEINWEFDPLYNESISGFIVKRMINAGEGFITISDTVAPTSRSYIDKNLQPIANNKYYYQVTALQPESYPLVSKRLTLFYDPYPQPSKPGILKAEPKIENGTARVALSWTEDKDLLSQIKGYQIRSDFGNDDLASDQNIPLITDFSYNYEVQGVKGKKYLFSLFIVDKKDRSHAYSDTISVIIPSDYIPAVEFESIEVINNKIKLKWDYKEGIDDLAGFRLYRNGNLIADESVLTAEKREWLSVNLPSGKYSYTIQAVSIFGLKTRMSRYKKTGTIE